jgi:hypothetical protein
MLQGYDDTVLRAEALEGQLEARRRDAVEAGRRLRPVSQRNLRYEAKSDEPVRKNKSLCNKNKGTPLQC